MDTNKSNVTLARRIDAVERALNACDLGPVHQSLESLAGQLRHAMRLAAVGDDMTEVLRRIARGLRYASDSLHEQAGDVLVRGEWCTVAECWEKVEGPDDVPVHLRDDVPEHVRKRFKQAIGVHEVASSIALRWAVGSTPTNPHALT